jgi:hypothetical protein
MRCKAVSSVASALYEVSKPVLRLALCQIYSALE